MARPKRKARANARVPQSREEAAHAIARIGELRRSIDARKADADTQIGVIAAAVEEALTPSRDELAELEQGVQAYCEANRSELTNGDKRKFHDFGTGRTLWRARPPKVMIRGVKDVLASCMTLGLNRFVRTRSEIDKDAMLKEPETASAITGVSIKSEGEDFVIEPIELATEGARP